MRKAFRTSAFTPAQAERAMRDVFKGLPEGRGGFEEFAALLWESEMHRFPVNPQHWLVFRDTVLTGPAIMKASPRCDLIAEMVSAPGQVFLVADSGIPGKLGLRLCMATESLDDITRWIQASYPCQGVIGQRDEFYLLAFSIVSFARHD